MVMTKGMLVNWYNSYTDGNKKILRQNADKIAGIPDINNYLDGCLAHLKMMRKEIEKLRLYWFKEEMDIYQKQEEERYQKYKNKCLDNLEETYKKLRENYLEDII